MVRERERNGRLTWIVGDEFATDGYSNQKPTHLCHGIGSVGELVELLEERFERHALASSARAHSISLAFSSSFEGR